MTIKLTRGQEYAKGYRDGMLLILKAMRGPSASEMMPKPAKPRSAAVAAAEACMRAAPKGAMWTSQSQ